MNLTAAAISAGERLPLPDPLVRLAIRLMVARTNKRLQEAGDRADEDFARRMFDVPIAVATDAANAQHYELPPVFFELMLGPQRKYSCCFYDTPAASLADAEERALAKTAANAALADGQRILELGCGWGALSLWMARRLPNARIVAVSNSRLQRDHIAGRAAREGLRNLAVVTADVNVVCARGAFRSRRLGRDVRACLELA